MSIKRIVCSHAWIAWNKDITQSAEIFTDEKITYEKSMDNSDGAGNLITEKVTMVVPSDRVPALLTDHNYKYFVIKLETHNGWMVVGASAWNQASFNNSFNGSFKTTGVGRGEFVYPCEMSYSGDDITTTVTFTAYSAIL